jgi:hypothetical protein
VKVGDRVQVFNGKGLLEYSDVVFVPHAPNKVASKFVTLSTATRSVKVTPSHFVMAGKFYIIYIYNSYICNV